MTEVNQTVEAAAQSGEVATEVKPFDISTLPSAPLFLDSVDEAGAKIASWLEAGFDPESAGVAILTNGMTEEGALDPAHFPGRVVIHVLRNRATKTISRDPATGANVETVIPATVKAICIYPAPALSTLFQSDEAQPWLATIINTQLARVAVASIRDADLSDPAAFETAMASLPTEDADYWTQSAGGGSALASFDALYKAIRAGFDAVPATKAYKITKSNFKQALESTAFAKALYGGLEEFQWNGKAVSLFVKSLELAKVKAAKAGLDASIFDRWLATRDSVSYGQSADTTETPDDFNLDALFSGDEAAQSA